MRRAACIRPPSPDRLHAFRYILGHEARRLALSCGAAAKSERRCHPLVSQLHQGGLNLLREPALWTKCCSRHAVDALHTFKEHLYAHPACIAGVLCHCQAPFEDVLRMCSTKSGPDGQGEHAQSESAPNVKPGRKVHLQRKQSQVLFRRWLWRYGGPDRVALPADPCQWLVWPLMRARKKGLESTSQHTSPHSSIRTDRNASLQRKLSTGALPSWCERPPVARAVREAGRHVAVLPARGGFLLLAQG